MFDRAKAIDEAFRARIAAGDFPRATATHAASGVAFKPFELVDLFDSQLMSRHLDFMARRTKGKTFYSIGSSGHEGMAAVAKASRQTDMAFLHYRDGAFLIQRKKQTPGLTPLYDMALSFAASSEDPISGGRHKVLGCAHTFVPPQTSTIASHLPKAVGAAHSIGLARKLKHADAVLPDDAIILCSFGDASSNHSTAQGAINAAAWTAYQSAPMPLVFICEDNGIGISVPTPQGWIAANYAAKPGVRYMSCDGVDMLDAWRGAGEAIAYARTRRRPVFLHMRTVRLMGHAGADIEASYSTLEKMERAERDDPLLHSARILHEHAGLSTEEILARYETTAARVARAAEEACLRPRLETAGEVMAPIASTKRRKSPAPPGANARKSLFAKDARSLEKPQPLAKHINFALAELMQRYDNVALFGEDVARKGGVYGVTQGLLEKFGPARVLDTLLDEQTILGLAIGMGHNGFVPIPEIQFLAYLHNAEDQLRGEAATLSFFSNGQYTNPMVVRIAGLGYQKGFGGHFHNDNSFNVLRDIPGVIVACPSNGADAGPMLRECVRLAHEEGRVIVFLEPIALYQTADLHEPADKGWLANYAPAENADDIRLGDLHIEGDGEDLCIVTYGNGYYLSRQAAKILRDAHGIEARVVDLRWLAPLNERAIMSAAAPCANILVVDECRRTGSLSEQIFTIFRERGASQPLSRVTADDSFIPLGPAANHVLPSREAIVEAALDACGRNRSIPARRYAEDRPASETS